MSSRARKVPELPAVTTLSGTDLIIVEVVGANSTTTSKMTATNLKKAIISGPFDTDAAANTGGVQVGQLYYTGLGEVKVRLS